MQSHWASRIIPDFSQTTQGVKGFLDPLSLTFSSGNDSVKTEGFQFINNDIDPMEYVNSSNMRQVQYR